MLSNEMGREFSVLLLGFPGFRIFFTRFKVGETRLRFRMFVQKIANHCAAILPLCSINLGWIPSFVDDYKLDASAFSMSIGLYWLYGKSLITLRVVMGVHFHLLRRNISLGCILVSM